MSKPTNNQQQQLEQEANVSKPTNNQQLELAFPRPQTDYEQLLEECQRDPDFYATWQEAFSEAVDLATARDRYIQAMEAAHIQAMEAAHNPDHPTTARDRYIQAMRDRQAMEAAHRPDHPRGVAEKEAGKNQTVARATLQKES